MTAIRTFLVILCMAFLAAYAQDTQASRIDYSGVTNNQGVTKALELLIGTSGEWAQKAILGNNLTKRPIKIQFRDLSKISSKYSSFDALGWREEDQLYIFLNNKHKNAPPEALGCLLSHEAIHQDTFSSIVEETYGWTYEANVWMEMKKRNPSLKNLSASQYPLINRLNTIESMFKKGNETNVVIEKAVSTNPGYKDLPMHSPGF